MFRMKERGRLFPLLAICTLASYVPTPQTKTNRCLVFFQLLHITYALQNAGNDQVQSALEESSRIAQRHTKPTIAAQAAPEPSQQPLQETDETLKKSDGRNTK